MYTLPTLIQISQLFIQKELEGNLAYNLNCTLKMEANKENYFPV